MELKSEGLKRPAAEGTSSSGTASSSGERYSILGKEDAGGVLSMLHSSTDVHAESMSWLVIDFDTDGDDAIFVFFRSEDGLHILVAVTATSFLI